MVNLYKFKVPSRPTEPYAFELVEAFPSRSAARREMNDRRRTDKEFRYAVYDGTFLVSSTF